METLWQQKVDVVIVDAMINPYMYNNIRQSYIHSLNIGRYLCILSMNVGNVWLSGAIIFYWEGGGR